MNLARVFLCRIHYSQMYQVSIIAARRRLHKIDGVHLGYEHTIETKKAVFGEVVPVSRWKCTWLRVEAKTGKG